MGKSKRSKKKNRNKKQAVASPVAGSPGNHSAAAVAAASAATAGLLRNNAELVQRLRSIKQSDRETACLAIAHLFSSDNVSVGIHAAKELLKNGLMRALLPRLSDPSQNVRLHASGALRNLSSFSDPDVSDALMRDEALTPVLRSLHVLATSIGATLNESTSITPELSSGSAVPVPAVLDDVTWMFAEQVLAVLVNLCEESETATRAVSTVQNIEILLDWVLRSSGAIPHRIRVTSAQLLHIVSEQNASLAKLVIGQQGLVERVLALSYERISSEGLQSKNASPWALVLSLMGFLSNVFCTVGNIQAIAQVASMLPRILKILLLQSRSCDVVQKLSVAAAGQAAPGDQLEIKQQDTDANRIPDKLASDKILGLEVFTNLLLTISEKDEHENQEVESMGGNVAFVSSSQLHESVSKVVTDEDLVSVIAHTAGLQFGVAPIMSAIDKSPGEKVLFRLRARGLSCLGAICKFLDKSALSQVSHACWPSLFSLIRETVERISSESKAGNANCIGSIGGSDGNKPGNILLEASLGTASTIMEVSGAVDINLQLEEAHAQAIRTIASQHALFPTDCRFRAIALVGVSSNISHDNASHARMSQICIEVLNSETSLIIVARALDILFDLFCEDDVYKDIWLGMGIRNQLETLAPIFRKRWKADRAQIHDVDGAIVSEALLNLKRFIEYKKETGW